MGTVHELLKTVVRLLFAESSRLLSDLRPTLVLRETGSLVGVMAKAQKKKTCFVICPIGADDSPERRWSDDIFNHLIRPVTDECGFDAERIIEDSRPGAITENIVAAVYEADLVIADLTTLNPCLPSAPMEQISGIA